MPRILLTGYIYRDPDGMFVSHCNELDTDTWGPSIEEAQRLTPDMIETYFRMAAKIGSLNDVLANLSSASEDAVPDSGLQRKWQATTVDGSLHFDAKFEGVQAAA